MTSHVDPVHAHSLTQTKKKIYYAPISLSSVSHHCLTVAYYENAHLFRKLKEKLEEGKKDDESFLRGLFVT
jgi:hypothetical protein